VTDGATGPGATREARQGQVTVFIVHVHVAYHDDPEPEPLVINLLSSRYH
jgi:hypothetical protein